MAEMDMRIFVFNQTCSSEIYLIRKGVRDLAMQTFICQREGDERTVRKNIRVATLMGHRAIGSRAVDSLAWTEPYKLGTQDTISVRVIFYARGCLAKAIKLRHSKNDEEIGLLLGYSKELVKEFTNIFVHGSADIQAAALKTNRSRQDAAVKCAKVIKCTN